MKLAIAKLTIEYIFPMLSEVIFHTIPSVIRSRPSVPSEFQLPFFACTWPDTGHLTLVLGLQFCFRRLVWQVARPGKPREYGIVKILCIAEVNIREFPPL